MKFAYDKETGRITQRYWGDEKPAWYDNPHEAVETAEEPLSQDSRDEQMERANNIHEAGADYDPETETSVGYLCYDAETGEIYPEAEIRPLPDDEE